MVNEAAIAEAITDWETQESSNYSGTAKKYETDRKTLQRRFLGESGPNWRAHLESQGNLTPAQEEVLVDRINTLSARGLPPTPQFVKNLVQKMVQKVVGDHWMIRFVQRHDDTLESIYLDSIDYARRVADNARHFKHYFDTVGFKTHLFSSNLSKYEPNFEKLQEKLRKYRISPSNTYNMDEKGFLIGLIMTMRRIVASAQLKTKKLLGASQDGSREFISLLACICADKTALSPVLIYQGKSGDLQDSWLEDFGHLKDKAHFAFSTKG